MNFITKEKELVFAQILYLYIIPILLLYFGVIPNSFRYIMLLCIALLLVGIVKYAKWTEADFGIKRDFIKDFFPYILFILVGIFFLLFLAKIFPHEPMLNWWKNINFLLLFIPISILQEIAFRGILMNMLRRAFISPVFIISLNAGVFALIHVIYLNATLILPMTFIAGIGFAWIYYKYPNLILISISHIIFNFIGMILGFFVIK